MTLPPAETSEIASARTYDAFTTPAATENIYPGTLNLHRMIQFDKYNNFKVLKAFWSLYGHFLTGL